MDELTFLLILAGIGVILLIAMFTYYKHHKKIHDEIQDFNHHTHEIDDILLQEHDPQNSGIQEKGFQEDVFQEDNSHKASSQDYAFQDHDPQDNDIQGSHGQDLSHKSVKKDSAFSNQDIDNADLPGSFSATRNDHFDIDQVNINNDSTKERLNESRNKNELVDGVYINTKRVINNSNKIDKAFASYKNTTDTFNSYIQSKDEIQKPADEIPTFQQSTVQKSESKKPLNTDTQPSKHQPESKSSSQNISIVYDPVPKGVEELIISHTILSKDHYFSGEQLFKALHSAGLSFGQMNIFHYPGDDKSDTFALFSVANIVEPGTFNLDEAQTFSTPGISMFMRLPTRIASNKAYEKFIHIAQLIATEIDGELCDETRNQLTQQAISYKKEQIRKLNFNMAKAKKLSGLN